MISEKAKKMEPKEIGRIVAAIAGLVIFLVYIAPVLMEYSRENIPENSTWYPDWGEFTFIIVLAVALIIIAVIAVVALIRRGGGGGGL